MKAEELYTKIKEIMTKRKEVGIYHKSQALYALNIRESITEGYYIGTFWIGTMYCKCVFNDMKLAGENQIHLLNSHTVVGCIMADEVINVREVSF